MRQTLFTILLTSALLVGCGPDDDKEPIPEQPSTDNTEQPETKPDDDTDVEESEIPWETAREAVANMKVGWNLGNTLDAHTGIEASGDDWYKWETCWGQPQTTPELIQMMKDAGFNAIRVPVTWYPHMDSEGNVSRAWLNRVHEVVDYVINAGMYCILNVHHDTGAYDKVWLIADNASYSSVKVKYEYLWKQIAEEFKEYDNRLLFESFNEMLDKDQSWCFASFAVGYDALKADNAYNAINSYAQSFVDAVRSTGGNNSVRNLVVNTYAAACGAGTWNEHLKDPLKYMSLPNDRVKDHIIFEVHTYPNVKDLTSAKREVDDMFAALNTYLALEHGAPVIIGEWGTSNDGGERDYDVRRDNVLAFADYFVKKAMEYDMTTFYWMGLSDASVRSFPAFNQPDLALAILRGYYGADYDVILPDANDFDVHYKVTYNTQWSELHVLPGIINVADYKTLRIEFDREPEEVLQLKIYKPEGGEIYLGKVSSKSNVVTFSVAEHGEKIENMTLQYSGTETYSIGVDKVVLVRSDGTEEDVKVRVFWGCDLEVSSTRK